MDGAPYTMYPLGDQALTIELGNTIEEPTNELVMRVFHQLQKTPPPFVLDIIPAYSSITIVYQTAAIRKAHPGQSAFDQMKEALTLRLQQTDEEDFRHRLIEIPVCYDPELGPDIETLATHAGISVDDVIRKHTATIYRVYMIGFLPGFAYMASVDPAIRMPRKLQPRPLVAAGSVGIAGEQTGIYPVNSPGGWQIIGQTPLPMLDVSQESPCLLEPGDLVRFHSISLEEFNQLKKSRNV
ncbi:MAG: 5-oxoprolinase subunit PxpB [Sediminibacterium sp.]|nr:5-oxoprolinase subunit PxpB [Sediminibacterium sp.]